MNKRNLYDVLQLKENCSAQDIKNSFVELSKKYHPDKSNDKKHHAAFVEVNEAYSILSKPSLRTNYDQGLQADKDGRVYRQYYGNVYTTRSDPAFWANRARDFSNQPYYGIKGLKKVSNAVIVAICIAVAAVGVGVEYIAISSSLAHTRDQALVDSAKNHIMWELARENAVKYGKEEQVRRFKEGSLKSLNNQEINEIYARRLLDQQTDLNSK